MRLFLLLPLVMLPCLLAAGDAACRPLDLRAAANRGFADRPGAPGWTGQGTNDLSGLDPAAPVLAGGVTFALIQPAANGGRAVIGLHHQRNGFRPAATLPAEGTCDRIHLLHAAAWARAGSRAGDVVFRYHDGGEAAIPVRVGDTIGDWWSGGAGGALVIPLNDVNPQNGRVYCFAASFANPHPQRALAGIELRSAGEGPMWLVLAAVAADGPDALPPPPVTGSPACADWPTWLPGIAVAEHPLLDLSPLLDAPAGRDGFVRLHEGRFVTGTGRRLRFLGCNFHAMNALFPTHEQAERIALTLSRRGINLVRLHLMEKALIDTTRADRQHLWPDQDERMDRFDYLVKALVDRGIYLLLDSVTGLSGREFTAADGVEGDYYEHRPWAYHDPVLFRLGQEYARALLTRRNRYTGRAFTEEPGVAMAMLLNEQTLFFDPGTAKGTPARYRRQVQELFNRWLGGRYADRPALAAAWGAALGADEDPALGTVAFPADLDRQADPGAARRISDALSCLRSQQDGYHRDMIVFLRGLGLRVPIAGSNIVNTPVELTAQDIGDYTAHNAYYDHPGFLADAQGRRSGVTMRNAPLVLADPVAAQGETPLEGRLAGVKRSGKPFVSTESGMGWPHAWRSSYWISLAATAAHQDWDGILSYSFAGGPGTGWNDLEGSNSLGRGFTEFNDAARLALVPAAALLFLRGDVSAARHRMVLQYGSDGPWQRDSSINQCRFPANYLTWVSRWETAFAPDEGADATLRLLPGAATGPVPGGWSTGAVATRRESAAAARTLDHHLKEHGLLEPGQGLGEGQVRSDTGEILRDWRRGLILVDTPRSQGVTGFRAGRLAFRDVAIDCRTAFATVMVGALDDQPIATARRLLAVLVGRCDALGPADRRAGFTAADPAGGHAELIQAPWPSTGPVRIEPLDCTIVLPGTGWTAIPLAPDGSALAAATALPATAAGSELRVEPASYRSPWILLEKAAP
jgi:hypothetical protein